MAMDERERRLGMNEAVFREVNERVEEVHEELDSDTGPLVIICECGVLSCTERISTTNDELNVGMRGVNERLGYEPQPERIVVSGPV